MSIDTTTEGNDSGSILDEGNLKRRASVRGGGHGGCTYSHWTGQDQSVRRQGVPWGPSRREPELYAVYGCHKEPPLENEVHMESRTGWTLRSRR